ncbi:MAG: GNAT family N-acetyltransferase [Bacteroidota bacterium]
MIEILNRELTDHEFSRMKEGFDEHTLDNGVMVQEADRFTFVAEKKTIFVGTASGLAYKNGESYAGWFYLTDLFVEKSYRGKGWGGKLLRLLEQEISQVGVQHIWTWTAGYEAPSFYEKQGYHVFTSFENWYSDGSARVGFRKRLF